MTHAPIAVPPPLKPGDAVTILSPSGPVKPLHIAPGLELLRSWGLRPSVHAQTFAIHPERGYLAGQDTHRLKALQDALDDPECAAIFCSRGGYGAMRLLQDLDPTGLRTRPKHIIGFSDITALLLWALHSARTCSLHAPVIKSLQSDDNPLRLASAEALRAALFNSPYASHHGLKVSAKWRQSQDITGRVIAGNLSLIQAMLGTPYLPTLAGCILVIEDVTEPDYRLDRLLTSLKLRTLQAPPAAIVLGEFLACDGVYIPKARVHDYIEGLADEFNVPVAAQFPTSHGAHNLPIPVGLHARLNLRAGSLTFLDTLTAS